MGIMTHTQLESDLLSLFCLMSKVDSQTGLRIWSAIEPRHHKDILKSIATLKLKDRPEQGEFGRVIGMVTKATTTRNRLAHWQWALNSSTQQMTWVNIENRSGFRISTEEKSYQSLIKDINFIGSCRKEVSALIPKLQPAIEEWHEANP